MAVGTNVKYEFHPHPFHPFARPRAPHCRGTIDPHPAGGGLRFGLWCEIEGLGKNAQLALDHPDFAAVFFDHLGKKTA
jgi:hypothetical protein